MGKIDQHSLIPIGLAVVVIGGGAVWMTKQDLMTSANASAITALQQTYSTIDEKLSKIIQRLSSIEGELRRIPKRTQPPPELPDSD